MTLLGEMSGEENRGGGFPCSTFDVADGNSWHGLRDPFLWSCHLCGSDDVSQSCRVVGGVAGGGLDTGVSERLPNGEDVFAF